MERVEREPRTEAPPELSAQDREAFAMDLSAFAVTMPVILGSGSGTTTISVHMLDRLYRAYLAAAQPSLDPKVRKLLGAHHRAMQTSARNCSLCWNARASLRVPS